jgi:CDP-paratose 2-epimerase
MSTILVTGGAGFVGSYLAISLKKDHPTTRVVALDNLKRRGSELNMPRLKRSGVEFLHGDVRDPGDLATVGGFDVLIECSAEPSAFAGYGGSPEYLIDTNLVGAINCFDEARRHQAGIVFLSSSRIYPIAGLSQLPLDEQQTRFELRKGIREEGLSNAGISERFPIAGARTMYGATKLAAELLLTEYCEMYGLRAVVNRCGVLTGPWQMGKVDQGFVVLWIARHIFGGALSYLGYGGSGKQVRDILHIADLYLLVRQQLDSLPSSGAETYNVGGGHAQSISLMELTALTRDVTGKEVSIGSAPDTRAGDVPYYVTDNSKVTDKTGWTPRRGIREIVQDVADWINAERDQLKGILG